MQPTRSFSVIIPARNAASSIGRCLDSVFALDPPALEVIVVDDASDDETGAIAEVRGARVVRCERNLGPGLARNKGARAASGELLAFTDADCEVPGDWLRRLDEALSDDYAGVTGPYAGPTDQKLLPQLIHQTLRYSQRDMPSYMESSISCNLCFRKCDFDAAGGFPEYRLPWSRICYFGNEDEEVAHLVAKKTGRQIVWLRDNGVYHRYRTTLRGYWKQQAKYAEAILVSYARFPAMATRTTSYSRAGGAVRVLAACIALLSILIAPLSPLTLLGIAPFCAINAPCVAYVIRTSRETKKLNTLALACYPFLLFTALAWSKGLALGVVKGLVGLAYWNDR